ncbi:MAG: hypothetical protein CO042_02795, partial [Parcubacteria group bacterium CG_4_9_14_0_2_um_filter_41_8]
MLKKQNKKQFIPLSEAAQNTPYSAEYLSLLARKGKLECVKKGKTWFTTKEDVGEYIKQVGKTSDPAAGSDKAASESGRFASSGLVAGVDDPKSDPAAGSDKAAGAGMKKSDPAAGSDKAAGKNDKAAGKNDKAAGDA